MKNEAYPVYLDLDLFDCKVVLELENKLDMLVVEVYYEMDKLVLQLKYEM